jgi:hypothetical protein
MSAAYQQLQGYTSVSGLTPRFGLAAHAQAQLQPIATHNPITIIPRRAPVDSEFEHITYPRRTQW